VKLLDRLPKLPMPPWRRGAATAARPWRRAAAAPAADTLLLAEYAGPDGLLAAADRVRRADWADWDAHTPFPVHGMERAMGLRPSRVPWYVLVLGLGGAAGGMLLQWWVSAEAYPLVISGKPYFSWPAFVPIMFECGVLGGALGAVAGFLAESRLPRHHHPLFESARFERVSDDGFFLSLGAAGREEGDRALRLLEETGPARIERLDAAGVAEVPAGGPGRGRPAPAAAGTGGTAPPERRVPPEDAP